jgi:hypothetical protein
VGLFDTVRVAHYGRVHPGEYQDVCEWVGENYDADHFDLEAVNKALTKVRAR